MFTSGGVVKLKIDKERIEIINGPYILVRIVSLASMHIKQIDVIIIDI